MSIWTRIVNVFRRERLQSEFDAEFDSHIEEAIARGRDPAEVRRAFGSVLRRREDCQDIKLATWLESLRADVTFGWRQLNKHKVVSAAAVLSLALAVGACTTAFRLIDAVLLRQLPVRSPERLFRLTYEFEDRTGARDRDDTYEYPLFRELRAALAGQADLMGISFAGEQEVEYPNQDEPERARVQFLSGTAFGIFGLQPAAGRLLTASDDLKPGEHPVAVISYEYWTRRFARDPGAIGKRFRMGNESLQVIGVAPRGFTGTETGVKTDVFLPMMVNKHAIDNMNWGWFRTWVRVPEGGSPETVRQILQARQSAVRREYVKSWKDGPSRERVEQYIQAPLYLESAASGGGGLREQYERPLWVLAAIVTLVLLIACANVANLMTAQAGARGKEMALRVSIGAGKSRLLQLMFLEGAILSVAASLLGAVFAWWAAPSVLGMIGQKERAPQIDLTWDWRVLAFACALTLAVTLLSSAIPALRASSIRPLASLRSGLESPHSRRRVIHSLTAAQVGFCFLILFTTALFVTTLNRLTRQPLGFSAERVLSMQVSAKQPLTREIWNELLAGLRSSPQVESAGMSSWALLCGNIKSEEVWVNGERKYPNSSPYTLGITPGWLETMKVQLLGGRDFLPTELSPKAAIVNQAFARDYFDGQNPVGRTLQVKREDKVETVPIVGYVADVRYTNLRAKMHPTVFFPLFTADAKEDWITILLRTRSADPLAVAGNLRKEVKSIRNEFRVSGLDTQQSWIDQHLIKERLLATLSSFFALVAVILAGVGLYGVIQYSMLQRRREIGIHMALGARPADVAARVTAETFTMLSLGAMAGTGAGIFASRLVETLLFEVTARDPGMIAAPAAALLLVAVAAALPPVVQAIRIDPSTMLRTE